MKVQPMRNTLLINIRTCLIALAISILVPVSTLADATAAPACNALVSIANNLYLVNPAGAVLAQFTADGTPKDDVSLSPDGSRVAYAVQQDDEDTYEIADVLGRHGFFPVYLSKLRSSDTNLEGQYADAPLMDLSWMSNDVLRLTKHISPYSARFEFRRIPNDLAHPAHEVARPAFSINCVTNPHGGRVACIEPEGGVYLGSSISSHADNIFDETGFEGIAPEQTLTVQAGKSVVTSGSPSFLITIKSINNSNIDMRITPPNGAWEESLTPSGSFMTVSYSSANSANVNTYGFFPTVTNSRAGLVRINVVKNDSAPDLFDEALAWTSHGQGILIIRRTKTQAWLYLIRPRERDSGGDDVGRRAGRWTLVAKAPINIPEVLSMRFATPSLLLLKGDLEHFSEVPIQVGRDHGRETLTLGTVTSMPSTLTVQLNGASTPGAVLGWSCKAQRGVGTGDH